MTWKIYSLTDPRDGRVRYVGKANDIKRRMYDHVYAALHSSKRNYRTNWIRALVECGQMPQLCILEEGEGAWAEAEKKWIKTFRDAGYELVNATDGGEGTDGRICLPETRAKISASKKGCKPPPCTPEIRAKISAAHKGVPLSPEHCAKMSAANKGKYPSPETRAKMSAAARGRPKSPEHRAKIGAAGRGRLHTPEARAKMRAAWIARKSRCCA